MIEAFVVLFAAGIFTRLKGWLANRNNKSIGMPLLCRACELCGRELDPDVELCPTCDAGSPYFSTMRSET